MQKVGEWIEVRSEEEILRTLDANGCLEGMPFMPEMFRFCGKRFPIYKRAHKTCDTAFPVRGRRVENSVHLDTRCDGSAHGGCQASCLLFWKDAWLKPVDGNSHIARGEANFTGASGNGAKPDPACTESTVAMRAHSIDSETGEKVYSCQATRLSYVTKNLEWWEISQYVEDYTSGNVSLWRVICGFIYFAYVGIMRVVPRGSGLMLRTYDRFQRFWHGYPFPRRHGSIPHGAPTPVSIADLQPGELVRVKSYDEILKTLDTRDRNRGLYFDAEEVPYCGGTYKILKRVDRIVNERTGRMQDMKTPCFILDSVICQSRYSECRLFCPRSIYSYWRAIWLEPVDANRTEQRRPGLINE